MIISKYYVTYDSNQPVENEGSGGIVRAIMERRNTVVFPTVEALLEVGSPAWIQTTNRLRIFNTIQ